MAEGQAAKGLVGIHVPGQTVTAPRPPAPLLANLVQGHSPLSEKPFWESFQALDGRGVVSAEKAIPLGHDKSILFSGLARPGSAAWQGGIDSPPDNRSPAS